MKRIKISEVVSNEKLLNQFISDLKAGGVAVIPTDTLYGLAIDSDSPEATEKVYNLKQRDRGKPLILFSHSCDEAMKLPVEIPLVNRHLLEKHWPGQLTAVLKLIGTPFKGFSGSSIGIRVPDHPQLLDLLRLYPGNFLTTSANTSGEPPINDPDEIESMIGHGIDWLVDGGKLPPSEPSTVADLTVSPVRIFRQGKLVL